MRAPSQVRAVVVAAAVLLGGCSSEALPAPPEDTGPSTAQQLAALRRPGTLVSLTCVDQGRGGLRLTGVSAGSGDTVADLTIPFPANTRPGGMTNSCQPTFLADQPKRRWLQLFTPDFTKIAVEITEPATDATHVGYLDLLTNKITDLTAAPSGDFASAATDERPLFDPTGEKLWFTTKAPGTRSLVEVKAYSIDVSTGARTERGEVGSDKIWPLSQDRVLSTDGGGDVEWYLPNPSAAAVVAAPGGNTAALWIPDRWPASAGDGGRWTTLEDLPGGEVFRAEIGSKNCLPQGWLDEHTVLCGIKENYQLLTFSPDFGAITTAGEPLLPATDRENRNVVLSPDAKTMAFLSEQGTTHGLFTVDLRLGATPRKVRDLTEQLNVIAWF